MSERGREVQTLDIRTLIFLLALGDLAALLIIFVSARPELRNSSTASFLAGKLSQTLGWILLFLRDRIADLLSVQLGNALLLAGFAAEALAVGTVRGRDRRQEALYGAILLIGYGLFLLFSGSHNLRVVFASLATLLIFASLGLVLLRQPEASPLREALALAALLYALAHGMRALIASGRSSFTLFTPDLVQYLAFLPLYIALVLGTVGYILLLKEKDDEALRESEEKYRSVAERASEAIAIIQDGRYVYANRRAAELGGLSGPEELLGREFGSTVIEEDRERVILHQMARLEGKAVGQAEDYRYRRADGSVRWATSSASLIAFRGRPATLLLVADIDERRRQQERIEALLAEKELLLREVNHRVKNNLGVAMGLLALQANRAAGRPAAEVLAEAQSLLGTMSELYETLHRAGSTGSLSLRLYLPSIVDEVSRLFPREPPVRFELDIDDVELDARVLSPLGILLNEIMTNSLRHAFKDAAEPRILLRARLAGERIEILCADNGRGPPPGFHPASSEGFGSKLILALLGQLHADWSLEEGSGMRWRIGLPLEG